MNEQQQKGKSESNIAQNKDSGREKTNPPGQNPKQNDAPDHDVHHDESRVNPLDKGSGR